MQKHRTPLDSSHTCLSLTRPHLDPDEGPWGRSWNVQRSDGDRRPSSPKVFSPFREHGTWECLGGGFCHMELILWGGRMPLFFKKNIYVWSLAKISWVQTPAPQQGALPPQSYGEVGHSWGWGWWWESSVGGDPCWGNALGNNTLLRTSHLGDILHGRKTYFPALLASHYLLPAYRCR